LYYEKNLEIGEEEAIIECIKLSKEFAQFYNDLLWDFFRGKIIGYTAVGMVLLLFFDFSFGGIGITLPACDYNFFLMKIMITLTVTITVLAGAIIFNSFRAYYVGCYRCRHDTLNAGCIEHTDEKTIEDEVRGSDDDKTEPLIQPTGQIRD
jgi:hypothetical protein